MSKRTITVSLEKAQEWYKEGGPLRKLALEAFSKSELLPKPRSWKEFVDYKREQGEEAGHSIPVSLPSVDMAKKMSAYTMLLNVLTVWQGDWKPDWKDSKQSKWCVCFNGGSIRVEKHNTALCPLSFPTEEMANDFLKCFNDLLEDAVGLF